MSDDLWLGVCARTRITPVARAENGFWQSYGDFTQALPPDGKAFAPSLSHRTGDYVAFQTEANERPSGRDREQVSRLRKVAELLDFRKLDLESARRVLVERGVDGLLPGATSIVAALADGTCVVLRMEQHHSRAVFVAAMDGLEALATHSFDARVFKGGKISNRWIAVPDETIGPQVGTINWCRDDDFLESVLKRLKKVAVPNGSGVIARAQIPLVARQLAGAGLLPTGGEDLAALADRLGGFEADLSANAAAVDEIVGVLAALEPIDAALAGRVAEVEAEIRAELEPKVRADIEAGLGDLAETRRIREAEIRHVEAGMERALADAAEIETTRDGLRSALAEELAALGGALDAATRGADARGLADRIAERLGGAEGRLELRPGLTPPWSRTRLAESKTALDWSAFQQTVAAEAEAFGFAPDDVVEADVAARAGRLVVLPQASALAFLRCLAGVLAGGEVVRHPLDPSCIALDDVWRRSGEAEPTAFARAWTAARLDPRRFRVILLEGLQRTPMDLWLPSLVDALDAPERPTNLLVFGSLAEGFVDPDRIWEDLTSSAVAISPSDRLPLNREALARAERREVVSSWFDATKAPQPERAALAEALQASATDGAAPSVGQMLAAFRAAWAHRPEPTSALAMAQASTTRDCGTAWLGGVLTAAKSK